MKTVARKIGNSIGIIIPAELLNALKIESGDELYVSRTEDGISLTPYDPNFEQAMKAYEIGAKRYKNALRKLAK